MNYFSFSFFFIINAYDYLSNTINYQIILFCKGSESVTNKIAKDHKFIYIHFIIVIHTCFLCMLNSYYFLIVLIIIIKNTKLNIYCKLIELYIIIHDFNHEINFKMISENPFINKITKMCRNEM